MTKIKLSQSGIYKITNILNNNFYIGSTNCFTRRWQDHKNDLKKQKHHSMHMQNAWDKYGEANFKFEIIEATPLDKLLDREQHYLDTLKPAYNVGKVAYKPIMKLRNILRIHDDGSIKIYDNIYDVVSENLRPEIVNLAIIAKTAKYQNCLWKRSSEYSIGTYKEFNDFSESMFIPVKAINSSNEITLYSDFKTLFEAGFDNIKVRSVCFGLSGRKNHMGHSFEYLDEDALEITAQVRSTSKKEDQYVPIVGKNITTGEIITYPSISGAKADGFNGAAIYRSLHGKVAHTGNFTWNYADENREKIDFIPKNKFTMPEVIQIDIITGKHIAKFKNSLELKAAGFIPGDVTQICQYKYGNRSHKGYRFIFADPELDKKYKSQDQTTDGTWNKKAVHQIDMKTLQILNTYPSATIDGFSQAHVSACARGERRSHKGFFWAYVDNYKPERFRQNKDGPIPLIICKTIEGKFVKFYKNRKELQADEYDPEYILEVCKYNFESQVCGNFTWEFESKQQQNKYKKIEPKRALFSDLFARPTCC